MVAVYGPVMPARRYRPPVDVEDLPPGTLVARSKEPYRRVVAAAAAVHDAEENLVVAIRDAVLAGDSWGAMGAALGTSRQNAYRQFARKVGPVPPRRYRPPEPDSLRVLPETSRDAVSGDGSSGLG